MDKKYEILKDDYRLIGDTKIYRIRLLVDGVVPLARKGDLGGFVQREDNLDQEGTCWLYNNAIAMERANVSQNAKLYDDAIIFDNARARGNAQMGDYSRVFGYATIEGECCIEGNASVKGESVVKGETSLCNYSTVSGSAIVDSCMLYDNSRISGYTEAYNCILKENALISGSIDSDTIEDAEFGIDAFIKSKDDYISMKNLGMENSPCSFYNTMRSDIKVITGFFNGDINRFREAVKTKYGSSSLLTKTGLEYIIAAGLAELRLTSPKPDYSSPYAEKVQEFVNDGTFDTIISKLAPVLLSANSDRNQLI